LPHITMDSKQLINQLVRNGLNLSDDQIKNLMVYLELLVKWNKVINLVGRSDWRLILNDLVMDSFFLGSFLSGLLKLETNETVLDLGAGAGLPGIPLRLVWDQGTYYLVESRVKRAAFMNQAIAAMNIENTFVINRRVQDIDPDILPARLIISRAFMPWTKLLPLAGEMMGKQARLIVLSAEEFKGQDLSGFRMVQTMEYLINEKKRYFWALESNI
jgi:16S rRNA (guanine527-N7)-methyltransferase